MAPKRSLGLVCCAVLVCLVSAGCVSPGRVDAELITRYQASVLARSPQPRMGTEGTALLTARPEQAVIPLKVYVQSGPMYFDVPAEHQQLKAKYHKLQRPAAETRPAQEYEKLRQQYEQLKGQYQKDKFKALAAKFPDAKVGPDGELTVRRKDWWFDLRRAWSDAARPDFELLLRLYVEAKDQQLLDAKLKELQAILGKPASANDDPMSRTKVVYLSLDQAVRLALANSVDIRVVSFEPAIAREEMVKAAAEFDYVVFAALAHARTDRRAASGLAASKSRDVPLEAGIRKRTTIGTQLELKYELTRMSDNSPFTVPDPRYESMLSLQLTQPLLRLGGADVNLAALRVAQLGHKFSLSEFRQQVEQVVTNAQTTYWSLVQVRKELEIQQRLLDGTIETRDRVRKRRAIDATDVEVKQTKAAVEGRRAVLLRTRRSIFDVQDLLARLLADPRLGLTGRYIIKPVTQPVDTKVSIDPADQLVSALRYSPMLEQARIGIESADVNVRVARNGTLPLLNLSASVSVQGLKGTGGSATSDMFAFDFFSHSVAMLFEYPLGNRGPKAELRKRRYERLQTITQLQYAADRVATAVNEAVRQIDTTFEEIKAQRAAVGASRVQLRALEDIEQIRGRLTPEFLQVKLQAQESLAAAERAEIQVIVNHSNALAELARVTGTTLQQRNIKLATESAITGRPLPRRRPAPAPR